MVPNERVDSNARKIMSCLGYQILKLGFQVGEDDMVKRVMISELPITTRKWRKYAQYVIQRPELKEEEKALMEEQKKRIEGGETIPEEELIKEPEPYEEKVYRMEEFEMEGQAYEEFLLNLMDYQDVVKAKNERWKLMINSF